MARSRKKKDYPAAAEAAGYEVTLLHEAYTDPDGTSYPAQYRVEGHGTVMSLTEDETDLWEALLVQADAVTGEPTPPESTSGPEAAPPEPAPDEPEPQEVPPPEPPAE